MKALEINLEEELSNDNLLVLNLKILSASESTPVIIYLPKNCVQFFSESNTIANEYLEVAYIGERLSKVSKQIKLSNVAPNESGLFSFTLSEIDKKALTDLLEEIVGYSDSEYEEDELEFIGEIQEFIDFAENNEIRFPELFEKYKEFNQDIGSN